MAISRGDEFSHALSMVKEWADTLGVSYRRQLAGRRGVRAGDTDPLLIAWHVARHTKPFAAPMTGAQGFPVVFVGALDFIDCPTPQAQHAVLAAIRVWQSVMPKALPPDGAWPAALEPAWSSVNAQVDAGLDEVLDVL